MNIILKKFCSHALGQLHGKLFLRIIETSLKSKLQKIEKESISDEANRQQTQRPLAPLPLKNATLDLSTMLRQDLQNKFLSFCASIHTWRFAVFIVRLLYHNFRKLMKTLSWFYSGKSHVRFCTI